MTVYTTHDTDIHGVRAIHYLASLGADTRILRAGEEADSDAVVLFSADIPVSSKFLRHLAPRDYERGISIPDWATPASQRVALRSPFIGLEENFQAALREMHMRLTDWTPVRRKKPVRLRTKRVMAGRWYDD